MPETTDAPPKPEISKKPPKLSAEERVYNLLKQVTPHIGKKFLQIGATKLTEQDVLAVAEKNPDIQTDTSGNITMMALIQSIVLICTGKKIKALRHPTQETLGGFMFEDPTVIQSKPKQPIKG